MTNENREKYSLMSIYEKKAVLRNMLIPHPRLKKAISKIKHCHDSKTYSNEPQCMYVTGPLGSGKSTVFKTYIQRYEKVIPNSTGTKRNILSAKIPSPVRISTFTEALLDKLGDPYPTSGTIGNKIHRLQRFIKDCEVELILLDEFQHFVKTEKPKDVYHVADNFKSLINETEVAVVLFGLGGAKEIFKINEQLGRRFTIKEELEPFSYKDEASIKEFRMLLSLIDREMPFLNLAGFGEPDIANKIMSATDGLMNSIMKLLKDAAINAMNRNSEKIDMKDLKYSFDLHSFYLSGENKKNVKGETSQKGNPFN